MLISAEPIFLSCLAFLSTWLITLKYTTVCCYSFPPCYKETKNPGSYLKTGFLSLSDFERMYTYCESKGWLLLSIFRSCRPWSGMSRRGDRDWGASWSRSSTQWPLPAEDNPPNSFFSLLFSIRCSVSLALLRQQTEKAQTPETRPAKDRSSILQTWGGVRQSWAALCTLTCVCLCLTAAPAQRVGLSVWETRTPDIFSHAYVENKSLTAFDYRGCCCLWFAWVFLFFLDLRRISHYDTDVDQEKWQKLRHSPHGITNRVGQSVGASGGHVTVVTHSFSLFCINVINCPLSDLSPLVLLLNLHNLQKGYKTRLYRYYIWIQFLMKD